MDWAGTTFGVGLTVLLIGITTASSPTAGAAPGGPTARRRRHRGGLALLVAFVMIERRVDQPMVDVRLFRSTAFGAEATSPD